MALDEEAVLSEEGVYGSADQAQLNLQPDGRTQGCRETEQQPGFRTTAGTVGLTAATADVATQTDSYPGSVWGERQRRRCIREPSAGAGGPSASSRGAAAVVRPSRSLKPSVMVSKVTMRASFP